MKIYLNKILKFCFIFFYNFKYQENFIIKTEKSNLTLVFSAVGVDPSFSLSFDGNVMDFGYCLANEKSDKNIEVQTITIKKFFLNCI